MKTKLPGKLSHYDKMAASAQQLFKEATACRVSVVLRPRL